MKKDVFHYNGMRMFYLKKNVLRVLNVFKKCFRRIIFTFDFSCCSRTKEIIKK